MVNLEEETTDKLEEKEEEEKSFFSRVSPTTMKLCIGVSAAWFLWAHWFTDYTILGKLSIPIIMGIVMYWDARQAPSKGDLLTAEESKDAIKKHIKWLKKTHEDILDFKVMPECDIERINYEPTFWKHRVILKKKVGLTEIDEEWMGITEVKPPAIPRMIYWGPRVRGSEARNVEYILSGKTEAIKEKGLLRDFIGGRLS